MLTLQEELDILDLIIEKKDKEAQAAKAEAEKAMAELEELQRKMEEAKEN